MAITQQEMARRLRKYTDDADVMTLSEFQRFMGLSRNKGADKLRELPRLYGKYYMVEDVAALPLRNLEE